jgi:hypothetical protein
VSKITNSKHQITNKSQIPIFNDQNLPGRDIVWIFELRSLEIAYKNLPAYPLRLFGLFSINSIPKIVQNLSKNDTLFDKKCQIPMVCNMRIYAN